MKATIFHYLCACALWVSCSSSHKEGQRGENDVVDIKRVEVLFPPTDVLQLKSYYLSSYIACDSNEVLIGYNYKEHALDCINIDTRQISQIPLQQEGPDAIIRLTGIYGYKKDSIWLSDESERVFLINSNGHILKRMRPKDYLDDKEELILNTNHAMSTVHLYYDAKRPSLVCTVKDRSTSPVSFKVKEIPLQQGNVSTYELSPSVVESNTSEEYVNMSEPNVNFQEEYIVYNYPIESHIYLLNRQTGKREVIQAESRYTANKADKCSSKTDYTAWERHGFENPHFFDVMYIPRHTMYARLHFGSIDFDTNRDLRRVAYQRPLYLMLFDKDFRKLCEVQLPSNRYNPYTGWNTIESGIVFFVDGEQGHPDVEDLIMELVYPVEKEENQLTTPIKRMASE